MWQSLILVGFILLAPQGLFAQDADAEFQKKLGSWLDKGKPGPEHLVLDQLVGSWTVETKTLINPDEQPTVTKGEATVRWVLGKRFLLELQKSKVPMPNSKGEFQIVPFEGVGLTGFDRHRNLYVASWADTMGTNMMNFSGTASPKNKNLLRMFGELDEPLLGVVARNVRYEIVIESEDKHTFTIYDLAVADDHKVVEITYTRKSSARDKAAAAVEKAAAAAPPLNELPPAMISCCRVLCTKPRYPQRSLARGHFRQELRWLQERIVRPLISSLG